MKAVPAGDNAMLVELGDVTAEELHAAAREMRARPGMLKVVPGHSSLYVIHGSGTEEPEPQREPREHRIRVAFDGPDLGDLHVDREEFLARVQTLRFTVRYLGFRGGFAYLDGWPEEWAMPRRPTSRPVNAGSFAVAGTMAGFYPIDTPGGWNILGRTDADVENAFVPGDVIFVVPGGAAPASGAEGRRPKRPPLHRAELISSPLTTILGVPFDDVAAELAKRAVTGNVELLECAMIGPRLRFEHDAAIAWCTPDLQVQTRRVQAGEELSFGRITGGLRGYLAVGDEPDVSFRASARNPPPMHDDRSAGRGSRAEARDDTDRRVIRAMKGPHETNIDKVECEVTPQLDRVGIRLRPLVPLNVDIPANLKSIGMQCGTVQLHPDGSLVAMGPDHPVTGGYLQPMTVITSERWKLAQLVPGERVTIVAL